MKQFILLAISCMVFSGTFAQESFKKKYKIPGWITFKESTDTLFLVKDTAYSFKDLADSLKNKIKTSYPAGQKLTVTRELTVDGEKRNVTQETTVNDAFYNSISQTITKRADLKKTPFQGYVKFEENTVWVNPFLRRADSGKFAERDIYYYKLKNRQTIKLYFSEWTVSTLIIPIKYRFKNGNVPEDFTTAFNANFFFGRSWGKSSFFHQEKVDNKSNTWKFTTGILVGASVTELNAANTKSAAEPLTGDIKYNKGLASLGFGGTYAYNKINVGLFCGWDFAIGESANKWDYNKRPWLGIALGYSLFQF